jgi:CelD/BcsL family acetyltransferase involved in cellulose biosynthesis
LDVPAGGIATEILTQRSELAGIADEWRGLAVAARNPFLTPEWYFSYLDHAPAAQPSVVVVRQHGALQLLLTLVREGSLLRFAGGKLGDCFRPLLAAGAPPECLDLAFGALNSARSQWRLARFDRVEPEDSGDLAAALKRAGANLATTELATLPAADLAGLTWDSYLAKRSHNFRSEFRRKERTLAKQHQHKYVEARGVDEIQAALTDHFDLHERRWPVHRTERRSADGLKRFHRAFATEAATRGWARLWQLRVDGQPIASWYGWNLGGRYLYYQAGLHPDWSRFSPGTLLLGRTIQAAIEEQCSTYDFLLGEETYKRRFCNESRDVTTLTAAPRPSLRLVVAAGKWEARKRVKQLPMPVKQALRRTARGRR